MDDGASDHAKALDVKTLARRKHQSYEELLVGLIQNGRGKKRKIRKKERKKERERERNKK